MDITNFAARLKGKKIKIEKSQQPGSVQVVEQRFDPLTGEKVKDAVSNVRVADIEKERANYVKNHEERIARLEENAKADLANFDAAIEACSKVA
jgi:hypothetical protein